MARYNEILVGRFNQSLQKLFGIKGEAPVPQVSSEIMAVHALFTGHDNLYHEGWNHFAIFVGQAAVAANLNAVRFRNPPGSNTMAVFHKISVGNDTAATQESVQLETQTTNADLPTSVPLASNVAVDKRTKIGPSLIATSQNAVAPSALSLGRDFAVMPGSSKFEFIQYHLEQFILSPGEAIQIRQVTPVNTVLNTVWWWRERFLEDSERN